MDGWVIVFLVYRNAELALRLEESIGNDNKEITAKA
jgi:hypothetical protein